MKAQIWSTDIIMAVLGVTVIVLTLTLIFLPRGGQTLDPAVQNSYVVRALSGKEETKLLKGNVLDQYTLGTLATTSPNNLRASFGITSSFCIVMKDGQGKMKYASALKPKAGKTERDCRNNENDCERILVCSIGAPAFAGEEVMLKAADGSSFTCGIRNHEDTKPNEYGCP